jgi:hypothetical protein
MYGILLIIASLILKNVWVCAIGFGLFIDEVPYLLIKGKNHADNYSWKSLVLLVIFVVVVFFLKDFLTIILT